MPSIADNRERWASDAGWDRRCGGERWSRPWGTSAMQWRVGVLPRIEPWLPAEVAVEIAPGHGRFSRHLRPHCGSLTLVDLDPGCVDACRRRFAGDEGVRCLPGDGTSLRGVADGSVDLVFSYDSLVHAETDAMKGYVRELARVLRPGGVAFLHHSNLGAHRRYFGALGHVPRGARRALERLRAVDRDRWRAPSVDARWMRNAARREGLAVPLQECVPWRTRRAIDCFSWLEKTDDHGATRVVVHHRFMDEAAVARHLASLGVGDERGRP